MSNSTCLQAETEPLPLEPAIPARFPGWDELPSWFVD
jgi:hypothetical protein